jgi:hypothetical protein
MGRHGSKVSKEMMEESEEAGLRILRGDSTCMRVIGHSGVAGRHLITLLNYFSLCFNFT